MDGSWKIRAKDEYLKSCKNPQRDKTVCAV